MSSKGSAASDAIPVSDDVLIGTLHTKDIFLVDPKNPFVNVDPSDSKKGVLSDNGKLLLTSIKRSKQWPALTITIAVLAGIIVVGGIVMFMRRNKSR